MVYLHQAAADPAQQLCSDRQDGSWAQTHKQEPFSLLTPLLLTFVVVGLSWADFSLFLPIISALSAPACELLQAASWALQKLLLRDCLQPQALAAQFQGKGKPIPCLDHSESVSVSSAP